MPFSENTLRYFRKNNGKVIIFCLLIGFEISGAFTAGLYSFGLYIVVI